MHSFTCIDTNTHPNTVAKHTDKHNHPPKHPHTHPHPHTHTHTHTHPDPCQALSLRNNSKLHRARGQFIMKTLNIGPETCLKGTHTTRLTQTQNTKTHTNFMHIYIYMCVWVGVCVNEHFVTIIHMHIYGYI